MRNLFSIQGRGERGVRPMMEKCVVRGSVPNISFLSELGASTDTMKQGCNGGCSRMKKAGSRRDKGEGLRKGVYRQSQPLNVADEENEG